MSFLLIYIFIIIQLSNSFRMHSSLFPSVRYNFLYSLTKKNTKFFSIKSLSTINFSSNPSSNNYFHSSTRSYSSSSSIYSQSSSFSTAPFPSTIPSSPSSPSLTSSISPSINSIPTSQTTTKLKINKKIETPLEGVVWIDPYIVSCLNSKNNLRKTKILFSTKDFNDINNNNNINDINIIENNDNDNIKNKFLYYTEEKLRDIINKRIPELENFPYSISYRKFSQNSILKNENSTTSYQIPLKLLKNNNDIIEILQEIYINNINNQNKYIKNDNNKDHLEIYIHGNGNINDNNFIGAIYPSNFSFLSKVTGGQLNNNYYNKKKNCIENNIPSLKLINDPYLTSSYTIVSFFIFKNILDNDLEKIRYDLINLWGHFHTYGRVYVAKDGINAQMAVPTNVLKQFQEVTLAYPHLSSVNINIDTELSRDDYFKRMPFSNLHIRIRDQALSDGFNNKDKVDIYRGEVEDDDTCSLDWRDIGIELSPLEWHEALRSLDDALYNKKKNYFFKNINSNSEKLSSLKDEPLPPLVLDIRNHHEWTVGRFDFPTSIEIDEKTSQELQLNSTNLPLSPPLYTPTFAYTWPALDEILSNTKKNENGNINKNRPIFTYCTGGARCGKAGAYLRQTIGADRVYVLKGGVLAYHRELNKLRAARENVELDENGRDPLRSLFIGSNYVFDDRIQEKITDDSLSVCETCGGKSSTFVNCVNTNCNIQLVQCPSCSSLYGGCCSFACKKEAEEMRKNKGNNNPYKINKNIGYSSGRNNGDTISNNSDNSGNNNDKNSHNQPNEIKSNLHAKITEDDEYSLALDQYCEKFSITEPEFLSYMREEASKEFNNKSTVLRMISGQSQGSILSLFASFFDKKKDLNNIEEEKEDMNNILELGSFIGYSAISLASDYSKWPKLEQVRGRRVYTCETDEISKNLATRFINESKFDQIININHLTAEEMIKNMKQNNKKFNLIFIDADKKNYLNYLKDIIGNSVSDSLLNDGAFIIFDNVLWKGLVLNYDDNLKKYSPPIDNNNKTSKRYLNIAKSLHELNSFIKNNDENNYNNNNDNNFYTLSQIMLPLRDGLSIVKYNEKKKL